VRTRRTSRKPRPKSDLRNARMVYVEGSEAAIVGETREEEKRPSSMEWELERKMEGTEGVVEVEFVVILS